MMMLPPARRLVPRSLLPAATTTGMTTRAYKRISCYYTQQKSRSSSASIIKNHHYNSFSSIMMIPRRDFTSSSPLLFLSSSSNKNNSTHHQHHRPQKWWERIQNFPKNATKLCNDISRSKTINDASKTIPNAWNGTIPRRQTEQQRMVLYDVRIALPLLIVSIPPFIGYIPVLLAILSPRQWMSRQFFNTFEIISNARIELSQRQMQYKDLAEHFWTLVGIDPRMDKGIIVLEEGDSVGPIVDFRSVVEALHQGNTETSTTTLSTISRHHMITLALASGYLQRFPSIITKWLVPAIPFTWLCYDMEQHAYHITKDDDLLIDEGYDIKYCHDMTDDEVLEACLIRGMPITTVAVMREQLTIYLTMMRRLREELPSVVTGSKSEPFRLFTLHVTALRCHLKIVKSSHNIIT